MDVSEVMQLVRDRPEALIKELTKEAVRVLSSSAQSDQLTVDVLRESSPQEPLEE